MKRAAKRARAVVAQSLLFGFCLLSRVHCEYLLTYLGGTPRARPRFPLGRAALGSFASSLLLRRAMRLRRIEASELDLTDAADGVDITRDLTRCRDESVHFFLGQ